ncbi:hypothetical protein CG434_21070 [Pantoea ananatis]|nr:hypothetical protein CG434_21070 [Pantoea ananatis]
MQSKWLLIANIRLKFFVIWLDKTIQPLCPGPGKIHASPSDPILIDYRALVLLIFSFRPDYF